MRAAGGENISLGLARPDQPAAIEQDETAYPKAIILSVAIQPHQLMRLEDGRNNGDLHFSLEVAGEGGVGEDRRCNDPIQGELQGCVPRSAWIEQLRAARALDILLIEVPMPANEGSGKPPPAGQHLRQAQRHFVNGDYRACVGECRQVIESLGGNAEALNRLSQNRTSMSKAERLDALLACIRHYAHLAHHPTDDASSAHYNRDEAKFVLQLTAACATQAAAAGIRSVNASAYRSPT
ncbi:MAG: hypothetical protein HC850_16430 [Rhodomicrobium sp.]|nr:hypothetical protein [Rhodomicrobium sp.]